MTRFVFTIVGILLPVSVAAEVRTWADAKGKHTVEAEFVELKDDKVVLTAL